MTLCKICKKKKKNGLHVFFSKDKKEEGFICWKCGKKETVNFKRPVVE